MWAACKRAAHGPVLHPCKQSLLYACTRLHSNYPTTTPAASSGLSRISLSRPPRLRYPSNFNIRAIFANATYAGHKSPLCVLKGAALLTIFLPRHPTSLCHDSCCTVISARCYILLLPSRGRWCESDKGYISKKLSAELFNQKDKLSKIRFSRFRAVPRAAKYAHVKALVHEM